MTKPCFALVFEPQLSKTGQGIPRGTLVNNENYLGERAMVLYKTTILMYFPSHHSTPQIPTTPDHMCLEVCTWRMKPPIGFLLVGGEINDQDDQ